MLAKQANIFFGRTFDLDFVNGHCVHMHQGVWSEHTGARPLRDRL